MLLVSVGGNAVVTKFLHGKHLVYDGLEVSSRLF